MMDGSLGLKPHIAEMGRKVAWITARMTPVRLLKDLRLSINLFKVLIEPLIALGVPYYIRGAKTHQHEYESYANRVFKRFCLLPRSLPNDVLDLLIEPASNRFHRRMESMWLADNRRREFWRGALGDNDF